MPIKFKTKYFFLLFLISLNSFSQDVLLYNQFNGRFDFTFIGNTLNPQENTFQSTPDILASSSATLNLTPQDIIEKVYLYWAGSGDGDFEVKLNNQTINSQRNFSLIRTINGISFTYFSAFADITTLVTSTGNGLYTLSDLDNVSYLPLHYTRRTNFAGWAMVVVYKNTSFSLNQINVYDGLQAVPTEINITLSSLNVIDNQGAKIGFLAWEGDVGIAVNETLRINGAILSNPPLNPANNAFNGTNTITGSSVLYNMDLDIYNIQNNIQPGDVSAEISLTSGQDFVMINSVITKLNSQVPDATIFIDNIDLECNSKILNLEYTVYNVNSTNHLPANVPIAFYANNFLIGTANTINIIDIGNSESQSITLTIPNNIPTTFNLKIVVDDDGTSNGTITEINETNNSDSEIIVLKTLPLYNVVGPIESCNLGFGIALFDFSDYYTFAKVDPLHTVTFYETLQNAINNVSPIANANNYSSTAKQIFIRIDDGECFSTTLFNLVVINCLPTIYNWVSANNDGVNDSFFISGIRDIFLNFKLEIYNRWGVLLWVGNNYTENWKGEVTRGIKTGNITTDGTYYYILYLNDKDHPKPIIGYLYLMKQK